MINMDMEGKQALNLGRQREQGIREFSFDVRGWTGLTCFLTVEDPRGVIRPAGQAVSDGVLSWLVGNDATAEAGNKTVCVRGLADGMERRSALFAAYVEESHGEPGDAPEPVKGWIGELELAEAERRDAETARGTAETGRNNAESLRRSAEQERAAFYAGWTAALASKASAGQVMRRLVTCTITDPNIAALTITQDDDGQELSLTEAEIRIVVPENTLAVGTLGYLYLRINNITAGYRSVSSDAETASIACRVRTMGGTQFTSIKPTAGIVCLTASAYCSDGTTRQGAGESRQLAAIIARITRIYLYQVSMNYIPMGTVIEVWGRVS